MKATLFTATRAVDRDGTSADAICERRFGLLAAVDRLARDDAAGGRRAG
jgi:hypothetical protein